MYLTIKFIFALIYVLSPNDAAITAQFKPSSVTLLVTQHHNGILALNDSVSDNHTFYFLYLHGDGDISQHMPEDHHVIEKLENVTVLANDSQASFKVTGRGAGNIVVGINTTDKGFTGLNEAHMTITVIRSHWLDILTVVIGWMYFVAWSVSFYPQVVLNFRRKSVIGLNFDFLAYNITGFLAYGFFNIGMYWIPEVKKQYKLEHPWGVNPVLLNDVIFTIHAVAVTLFTIFQCVIYERGGQRVSRLCLVLVAGAALFSGITLVIAICQVITWLMYLMYFSYIKLGVTLIKYIPQAYMNFRRKSTDGWSIGNVLLDFTGGALSIVQMFLLAYNHDDWGSIFGDPTKFGLGFFSILFDILFMVQHYILYRGRNPYVTLPEDTIEVNPDIID